ncbi:hypothetical protein COOONC_19033, partial [Cooperia oncophora]
VFGQCSLIEWSHGQLSLKPKSSCLAICKLTISHTSVEKKLNNTTMSIPLDLMNYFPFWPTFINLTKVLGQIFGLEFHDVTDGGLERAHPDARIFSVDDVTTGQHLGRLYIDPFDREAKRGGWNTLLGRMNQDVRGLDKIVYLVGSAIASHLRIARHHSSIISNSSNCCSMLAVPFKCYSRELPIGI